MENMIKIVGLRIREYRRTQHLTQEELADKAGIHPAYIGQIERGEKNLTISSLSKILDALHVSFQDFFRGISPDSDPFVAELCMEIIARQKPQKQSEILQLLRDLDSILSN